MRTKAATDVYFVFVAHGQKEKARTEHAQDRGRGGGGGARITAVTVVVLRVVSVVIFAVLVVAHPTFVMLTSLTWPQHHMG